MLEAGEWMVFDVLPRFDGYAGDIARMRVAGDEDLDPRDEALHAATVLMNRRSIKTVKPA